MLRWYWFVVLALPPAVALTALPQFGENMVIRIGIYALMGLGYQLVFGQLGALNLAQGALLGIGAYTAGFAAQGGGLLALPAAAVAAAIPAAIVAVPTARLQSHYFALATLALASLVHLFAVNGESYTGGANGIAGFMPSLPQGTTLMAIVWLCLVVAVLAYAWLFAGRLGSSARLLREAPLVAATLGIDGGRWRLACFVVGGALAGLAGGFQAFLNGVVSPEATGFGNMVLCLTLVVIGGSRHPMGAVVGAVIAVCLPELMRDLQDAWLLAYAIATLLVVLWAPEGLAGLIDRRSAPAVELPVAPLHGPQRLALDGVVKRFGGVDALAGVSLALTRGEIVGLIGPNGSGKTTLLNVVSGLEPADGGSISLDDTRIERLPPHAIARLGVARTFQAQSWVSVDQAAASGAALLLLDEPAAGMGDRERAALEAALRRLRDGGRGVLIVDHDIELLGRVCDRLVCLDRGRVIAEGPPAQVRADTAVRASFLGLEAA
jgi:branched-chain amino acid transport system permease protein